MISNYVYKFMIPKERVHYLFFVTHTMYPVIKQTVLIIKPTTITYGISKLTWSGIELAIGLITARFIVNILQSILFVWRRLL